MYRRKRSPNCESKTPDECKPPDCWWDNEEKTCKRRRSPVRTEKGIYNIQDLDIGSLGIIHSYLYSQSDIVDLYPHNMEKIVELLPTADRNELVLLLNKLPHNDWLADEIMDVIQERSAVEESLDSVPIEAGYWPFIEEIIPILDVEYIKYVLFWLAAGGQTTIINYVITNPDYIEPIIEVLHHSYIYDVDILRQDPVLYYIGELVYGSVYGGHVGLVEYYLEIARRNNIDIDWWEFDHSLVQGISEATTKRVDLANYEKIRAISQKYRN